MKILRESPKPDLMFPREFTCPECRSVLEIELSDCVPFSDGYLITCIVCGEFPYLPAGWTKGIKRLKQEYIRTHG